MGISKDTMMKVGIVAAIALIIYLVYRSRSCKDTYAEFVPSPDYAENMFREEAADYAEEGDEYFGQDQYNDFSHKEHYTSLMESTLDDDEANAVFEPGM